MTCRFCRHPSILLCDGQIFQDGNGRVYRAPNGGAVPGASKMLRTCDAPLCHDCAATVGRYHVNRGKQGCYWQTVDLCRDCQAAQIEPAEVCMFELDAKEGS